MDRLIAAVLPRSWRPATEAYSNFHALQFSSLKAESKRFATPKGLSLANRLASIDLEAFAWTMKTAARFAMALVTVPDVRTGRRLAKVLLAARLAACVNLLPRLESHYWWQGKLERSGESLLLIKTTRRLLVDVEAAVLANHPYDTPELVVLTLSAGNERYLAWLAASASAKPSKGRSP